MTEENAQIKLKKEQLMVIAVIRECREGDVHLITLLPVFVLQGGFICLQGGLTQMHSLF